MTRALVTGAGPAATVLKMAQAYMRGEWDEVSRAAATLEFNEAELVAIYLQAVALSDAEMSELAAAA